MNRSITLSALLFASLLFTTMSFSQDAEKIKEQTLQVCKSQAQQLEQSQQESAMKVCECTTDNTDYNNFLADLAAGNITKLQSEASAIAQKCAEDLGAE